MAQTNPLINGLIDGDVSIYIEPLPSYVSNEVKQTVEEIGNSLNIYEPELKIQFQRVYNPELADIHISWIKNYGTHTAGESIFKSVIKVGLGSENCHGQWQPFDAQSVTTILIHELGHSLGFGHSNYPSNVMYFQTNTRYENDIQETITLDEGQIYTIPFCNAGTYSYNMKGSHSSNGFFVYVTTPGTNSLSFIEGTSGTYYPDCSGNEAYQSFSYTCTVPQGASLVIYNKDDLLQFNAINVQLIVTDLNQRSLPNFEWDYNAFEYDEAFIEEVWDMFH